MDYRIKPPRVVNAILASAPGSVKQSAVRDLRLQRVNGADRLSYRRAVETIGYYFKREFRYDFRPYSTLRRWKDNPEIGYLWLTMDVATHHSFVLGACSFNTQPERAELIFVWLHPYIRNRGVLTASMPYFQRQMDKFVVLGPCSAAMQHVAEKLQLTVV
jgi:hypothetical protein